MIEVPTMEVNFHLMGRNEIDNKIEISINQNIDYLNQEFEGSILFLIHDITFHPQRAYLPDLHTSYLNPPESPVMDKVKEIESPGQINIFVFDTYSKNGRSEMTGFTPILSAFHHTYKDNSPTFDRMFIAYPGLSDNSTIVHEMGHFLGLKHPWEMDLSDQQVLGLNNDLTAATNHMTYHRDVDHFTKEQLKTMQRFAIDNRAYLIKQFEVHF